MKNKGVYLLLGGNLGDREAHLTEARSLLGKSGITIVRTSALYETAAWGKTDQPSFLNQVIEVESHVPAPELMNILLLVEQKIGRNRDGSRWGPRPIDIDMLFFGEEVIDISELTLPHPQIQNRRFTLVPLAELAPSFVHPILNKTIARLLDECPDTLPVTIYPPAKDVSF